MTTTSLLLPFAERLMNAPAAAYHEQAVMSEVESICQQQGLTCDTDAFGNRIVTVNHSSRAPKLALVAHMDHPGFEAVGPLTETTWEARFLGGVGEAYFQTGIPLLAYPGGYPAVLGKRLADDLRFEIHFEEAPAAPPRFLVWNLLTHGRKDDRIEGRACDDLIGVAAILATLAELNRLKAPVSIRGLITRAEEVGFQGTLLLAESGVIGPDTAIVSLETSRELPPVQMGNGTIIRVGDRSSIFDSRLTRFLTEVAADLQTRHPEFRYQRALMGGGTCEATAFQEFGYRCAALCVALGNYHNCGPESRIAAEYVSAADAQGMVDLLVEAAQRFPECDALAGRLNARLVKLAREARVRLNG
ncbi:MAG: M20/M25/M40 family metallo-hydrolase [Verrucomicrobiales bacterium]|nr:M20/M25/M40 family metallo-hydrolase [Verrucomicrobiales bacterium]